MFQFVKIGVNSWPLKIPNATQAGFVEGAWCGKPLRMSRQVSVVVGMVFFLRAKCDVDCEIVFVNMTDK